MTLREGAMAVGDDKTMAKKKSGSSGNLAAQGEQTAPSRWRMMMLRSFKRQQRRWRLRRRLADLPLWAVTAICLAVFLFAALVVLYLLGSPWRTEWRLVVGELSWDKQLLYAAGVVTLSGAVVALVVNYRKQSDAETGRFSAAFAEAASQLGNASPAVRIAGVYALAALADRYRDRRQQCIDVLCGYIRLPYNPLAGAGHLIEHTVETTEAPPAPEQGMSPERTSGADARPVSTSTSSKKTVDKHAYRADDREVRLTIIRIIRDHLRAGATVSWQGHDFDFTGATFDGGDFIEAHFSGGRAIFRFAKFVRSKVAFNQAFFSGGLVDFTGARFLNKGGFIFRKAQFCGAAVNFRSVDFTSDFSGDFREVIVTDGVVDFEFAGFSQWVDFSGFEFQGGKLEMKATRFSGGTAEFSNAKFLGGELELSVYPNRPFSGSLLFPEVIFTKGRLSIDIRAAASVEGTVSFFSFDETFSGDTTVEVNGQTVQNKWEAERAFSTPSAPPSSLGAAPSS